MAFRRLKKIAHDAGNHELALECFAQEMRVQYGHKHMFLYQTYDFFSNYGRSILRPFIGLLVCWAFFSILHILFSDLRKNDIVCSDIRTDKITCYDYLMYSASQSVPFFVSSVNTRKNLEDKLFKKSGDDNIATGVNLMSFLQNFISGIFLFLIALALRNIYRS
jgi:hypothetical protein